MKKELIQLLTWAEMLNLDRFDFDRLETILVDGGICNVDDIRKLLVYLERLQRQDVTPKFLFNATAESFDLRVKKECVRDAIRFIMKLGFPFNHHDVCGPIPFKRLKNKRDKKIRKEIEIRTVDNLRGFAPFICEGYHPDYVIERRGKADERRYDWHEDFVFNLNKVAGIKYPKHFSHSKVKSKVDVKSFLLESDSFFIDENLRKKTTHAHFTHAEFRDVAEKHNRADVPYYPHILWRSVKRMPKPGSQVYIYLQFSPAAADLLYGLRYGSSFLSPTARLTYSREEIFRDVSPAKTPENSTDNQPAPWPTLFQFKIADRVGEFVKVGSRFDEFKLALSGHPKSAIMGVADVKNSTDHTSSYVSRRAILNSIDRGVSEKDLWRLIKLEILFREGCRMKVASKEDLKIFDKHDGDHDTAAEEILGLGEGLSDDDFSNASEDFDEDEALDEMEPKVKRLKRLDAKRKRFEIAKNRALP